MHELDYFYDNNINILKFIGMKLQTTQKFCCNINNSQIMTMQFIIFPINEHKNSKILLNISGQWYV